MLQYLTLGKDGKMKEQFIVTANSSKAIETSVGTPWLIKSTTLSRVIAIYNDTPGSQIATTVSIKTDSQLNTFGTRRLLTNSSTKLKFLQPSTSLTFHTPTDCSFDTPTTLHHLHPHYMPHHINAHSKFHIPQKSTLILHSLTQMHMSTDFSALITHATTYQLRTSRTLLAGTRFQIRPQTSLKFLSHQNIHTRKKLTLKKQEPFDAQRDLVLGFEEDVVVR